MSPGPKPTPLKVRPDRKASEPNETLASAGRPAGGELHQTAAAAGDTLTTQQGTPVSDDQNSLRIGARGPLAMEDFVFREKIFHFDHERIPERVVHARGYGAHGFFEPYEEEGAKLAVVAPSVGGVEASDGTWIDADQKLDGGPSVLFDAVALLPSADGVSALLDEPAARDFVGNAGSCRTFVASCRKLRFWARANGRP
jgi:hypothetical protein